VDSWAPLYKDVTPSAGFNFRHTAGLQPLIPCDFSRKPRSLFEYKHWKATELRLFLLYTGPVCLKGVLQPDLHANFLDLSVAVRLLLRHSSCIRYADYAENLLKYFVSCSMELLVIVQCQ